MSDVWELIEEAPSRVEATAELYHWSTNFDPGQTPFGLFLDLIGWGEDSGMGRAYDGEPSALGYLELSKLGAALSEYAERPHDVRQFTDKLMEAELAE